MPAAQLVLRLALGDIDEPVPLKEPSSNRPSGVRIAQHRHSTRHGNERRERDVSGRENADAEYPSAFRC